MLTAKNGGFAQCVLHETGLRLGCQRYGKRRSHAKLELMVT